MKKVVYLILSLVLLSVSVISAQKAEMDPEAAKLYNSGNKMLKSGNYEGAIEDYSKALEISKDYRIYYQQGIAYKKLRKFDKALESFHKCLETNPEFTIVYNSLGTTYYAKGDYLKAIENFKKFEESVKKPKLKKRAKKYISLAYTKLGDKELKNKNYEKGIGYLEEAVKYYNYDAAYLKLADAYIEMGNYQKALEAADNAIKYRSKKSKVPKGAPYFYKGLAYKGMKDKANAKQNFAIAAKDKLYRDRSKHDMKYMN